MLDWITNILSQIWTSLLPFEVVNHYDRGVKLRLGKPILNKDGSVRVLEPGFYFKIPLGVEDILTHMVKMTTMDLEEQSLTTADEKQVVVRGVLKYEVSDVAILLLEVDSPAAAVADLSMGIIKDSFAEKTWKECIDPDFPRQVATKIRREAKRWGINVISLTLTDLAVMRSIRLIMK